MAVAQKDAPKLIVTPESALERSVWDMLMKRYGVSSMERFMQEWNPAQVLLAVDAMFWNERKEADKFTDSPYELANARPITARMLAGID